MNQSREDHCSKSSTDFSAANQLIGEKVFIKPEQPPQSPSGTPATRMFRPDPLIRASNSLSAKLNQHPYGHFNKDGTEFIITNPDAPRALDNFLWNDACFSIVQHTGVGCFDYQPGDKEAIQLLTGIGRTCDFDVFGREHLMSRLVYIRDNDTGTFWNLNWEPVCRPAEKFGNTARV